MTKNNTSLGQDGAPNSWDMLARIWDMFEDSFFSRHHLEGIAEKDSPALVVGAGAGILYQELLRIGVRQVIGVDSSAGMARAALERRGLPVLVIENNSFPFVDGSFKLILCASGVISSAHLDTSRAVLKEVQRLLAPGGRLLIGLPSFHPDHPFRALGLIADNTMHFGRFLDIWSHHSRSESIDPLIMEWTDFSEEEASEIAEELSPIIDDITTSYAEVAQRLQSMGEDPEPYLRNCFSWSLSGFVLDEIQPFLEGQGLQVIELKEDYGNDLVLAICEHA